MPNSSQHTADYTVRIASWDMDQSALKRIREEVFIQEQSVPVALEWDGEDEKALHLLAETWSGVVIGTARMLSNGHIGRVAVLREWRHRGVGTALMQNLITLAKQHGHSQVHLDAQVEALDFYRRLDFQAVGDIFMDAGIPHRHMTLQFDA